MSARPNESKKDRFTRVAKRRSEEIEDKLRLFSNLANPARYDYRENDVNQYFAGFESALGRARAAFEGKLAQRDFRPADTHSRDAAGTNGGLLRAARQRAGLSQAELARRLPTSQSQISFWETGRQLIPSDQLAKIVEALAL